MAVAVTDRGRRGRAMLGSRVRSSEWDGILNTGLTEYILMRIVASSSAISWNSGTRSIL